MSTRCDILYVEDNPDDAQLMDSAFREKSVPANLIVVDNAVQAFSFLAKQAPFRGVPDIDMILLDLNLPVINGVKALSLIRSANSHFSNVPVTVFSSSMRQEDKENCIKLGILSYEVKPATFEGFLELAERLKNIIVSGKVSSRKSPKITAR